MNAHCSDEEPESNLEILIHKMTCEFKQASIAHVSRIQEILDNGGSHPADKVIETESLGMATKDSQGPESTFIISMEESPLNAEAEYFEAHVAAEEEDAPRRHRTKLPLKSRSNDTPSPFQIMQELQSVLLSRSCSSTKAPN